MEEAFVENIKNFLNGVLLPHIAAVCADAQVQGVPITVDYLRQKINGATPVLAPAVARTPTGRVSKKAPALPPDQRCTKSVGPGTCTKPRVSGSTFCLKHKTIEENKKNSKKGVTNLSNGGRPPLATHLPITVADLPSTSSNTVAPPRAIENPPLTASSVLPNPATTAIFPPLTVSTPTPVTAPELPTIPDTTEVTMPMTNYIGQSFLQPETGVVYVKFDDGQVYALGFAANGKIAAPTSEQVAELNAKGYPVISPSDSKLQNDQYADVLAAVV